MKTAGKELCTAGKELCTKSIQVGTKETSWLRLSVNRSSVCQWPAANYISCKH